MSWLSNPFARTLEPQEHNSDGNEGDDHVHGQGVKEDLSQLTQTFKRQLWGVATFLAPPLQAKDPDVDDDPSGVRSEASILPRHDGHLGSMGFSEDLVDVDFDAFLDETLDDKRAEALKGEVNGKEHTQPSAHGSLPFSSLPNVQHGLPGISRDLAELKGSVATGFSKILRAVRDEIDHVESLKSYTGNNADDEDDDAVSEKTQGLDIYLKPLINNILHSSKGKDLERTDASSDDGDDETDSKDDDNARPSNLQDTFMHGFRGISEFASSLISVNLNSDVETVSIDKRRNLKVVGITEEVLAFAKNISMHPETWLDFPSLPDDELDDFNMSPAQKMHLHALEVACPRLSALKTELCPDCMSEIRFWKIYFILVHSRLNKTDALLLSTPKIMQARAHLSQKLKNDKEHEAFMKKVTNSSESFEVFSLQSATSLPVTDYNLTEDLKGNPQTSGGLPDFLDEEFQNKDVLASTVKLATSSFKEADVDADRWLHEERLPRISCAASGLRDEDDVSFSDLEEDDGKATKEMGRSNSTQSFEWVQLNKTSSAENFEAARQSLPQASFQASRKQGQSESSDWSTVEEDDAASSD